MISMLNNICLFVHDPNVDPIKGALGFTFQLAIFIAIIVMVQVIIYRICKQRVDKINARERANKPKNDNTSDLDK